MTTKTTRKVKHERRYRLLLKKEISFLLLTGLLLFLYFIPRPIMYSEYKIVGWIVLGFVFGLLPCLVFTTLLAFTGKSQLATGLAALSVLIVGPTFGLYQEAREIDELMVNGLWAKAIVVDKKTAGRGMTKNWVIKAQFEVKDQLYTTIYHDDYDNSYSIGDTLKLIFSKEYPRINQFDYEWNKK